MEICFCKQDYSPDELLDLLNLAVERFNVPAFIEEDPVQFPRRYTLKQDIEIVAFLTATIAWGKRSLILKSAKKMLGLMGNSPFDYLLNKGYETLDTANIHRTFFEHDMAFLCRGLHAIYLKHDTLESLFANQPPGDNRLWDGLRIFREEMLTANGTLPCRSIKHISNPATAACKRLHLALKWLVRNDGIVDIGIWNKISPCELKIPLDIHVIRTAHRLGLLERTQNDRKAVEELTNNLKQFNPEDPVIYDFALFGLGAYGWNNSHT